MQNMLQPGVRLAAGPARSLADAIVSVEYYMETVQSGRSDPWYMLDNAEGCLRALADATSVVPAGLPEDSGRSHPYDRGRYRRGRVLRRRRA